MGVDFGVEPYPVIEDCHFENNDADTTDSFPSPEEKPYGGALLIFKGPATIRNCTFAGNTSGKTLQGEYGGYGGAIDLSAEACLIEGCTFIGNYAKYGGAIAVWK